jgi:hypothetical protein
LVRIDSTFDRWAVCDHPPVCIPILHAAPRLFLGFSCGGQAP